MTDPYAFPSPLQRVMLAPFLTLACVWNRPRAHGLELVPTDRPVVYVGKHPQAFLYFETASFGLVTYYRRRDRPPFKVMEKQGTSIHKTPVLGWLRSNFNAVPATEEEGLKALRGGESILLFPGGARELFGERDTLRWDGRRGYARIAALAGVEVVPFAIAGADRQHPWRVRIGQKNTLWLPPIPLPVRLDVHFGAPMRPPPPGDDEAIAAFADEVARTTQTLLDRAVAEQREAKSRRG